MRGSKVIVASIFSKLLASFLSSSFTWCHHVYSPFTSGKEYSKLVNNAVVIRNESFQLEHTPWLLYSVWPSGYQIRTIEYGKILVMLVYGE